MKNFKRILVLPLLLLTLLVSSCGTASKVPITGRSHRLLVDDQQVLSLSKQQYTQYMNSAKRSTDKTKTEMVKRVGQKLATAVETYLKNNGYAEEVKNFAWEFNLVSDKQVNAFCMPGGKIVVYEGLFGVAANEEELAVVLGHEIAHAVAKHSAEQMSTKLKQRYGTQVAGVLVGQMVGYNAGNLTQAIAQMGFEFKNLSYSRENETEADYMGLIFMAMAGYNPDKAVPFWQKMAANSKSKSDFLSDHPSDEKRVTNIQKWLPEARKYYKK